MRYLPHTEAEIAEMLRVVGAERLEDLFAAVPAGCRLDRPLALPEPLSEPELLRHAAGLAGPAPAHRVFLGAGAYDHHVPAAIPPLFSRAEFLTAYTPYQPEVSQGTLQAIYEYQTLVSRLLGMEISNASVYDGASALAEALLLAIRVTRRHRVALSRAVHPAYRQVVRTYLEPGGYEIVELPWAADGRTDLSGLDAEEDLAAVAVQSPNFFGCIEDLEAACGATRARGGLAVVTFTEALAYGLLRSPGACGADLACGEGQSLGLPLSFGGPYLGIFTARQRFLRQMPGRLVGRTDDRDGRPGFVITLATREQHIRREKATSNICSNQNLCALTAAAYLALLGKTGIRELARLNRDKAEYLKAGLVRAGAEVPLAAPTFHEFVVHLPPGAPERLRDRGFVPGLPLGPLFPELEGAHLVCVTETKSREDLDAFLEEVGP